MSGGTTPTPHELALKTSYQTTPPAGGMGPYCFNATEAQLRADFDARGFSDLPGTTNGSLSVTRGGITRPATCSELLCFLGLCSNCPTGISYGRIGNI